MRIKFWSEVGKGVGRGDVELDLRKIIYEGEDLIELA